MNTMTYFRFFQDLWRFFRDHSEPVSADSWWQRLADQGDALADQYGSTPFVIRMVSAAVWEIDRIYRRSRPSTERTQSGSGERAMK